MLYGKGSVPSSLRSALRLFRLNQARTADILKFRNTASQFIVSLQSHVICLARILNGQRGKQVHRNTAVVYVELFRHEGADGTLYLFIRNEDAKLVVKPGARADCAGIPGFNKLLALVKVDALAEELEEALFPSDDIIKPVFIALAISP